MKFSIKDFFRKSDQIRRRLRIWLHLLKKSLMSLEEQVPQKKCLCVFFLLIEYITKINPLNKIKLSVFDL